MTSSEPQHIPSGTGSIAQSCVEQTTLTEPAWVTATVKQDTRSQPWKSHVIVKDNVNFDKGQDVVLFSDKEMKGCHGAGTLAA